VKSSEYDFTFHKNKNRLSSTVSSSKKRIDGVKDDFTFSVILHSQFDSILQKIKILTNIFLQILLEMNPKYKRRVAIVNAKLDSCLTYVI